MPSAGPVTEVDSEVSTSGTPGFSFDPKPPQGGESATEIVANFLEAMKATPSRTSVAREFLTADAQRRWTPESAIVTYGELGDPVGDAAGGAADDGHREVRRPRRLAAVARGARSMTFDLTIEDGEWRIDGLPDALIVPETWFEDQFRRMSLYFFDPTAQILVPEPVFVPHG